MTTFNEIETSPIPDGYLENYDGFQEEWMSTSSMTLAMMCGMAFRFKYIDNLPEPKSIRLSTGSGIHKAREANLFQKIESHEDRPLQEVTDAARDAINETFDKNPISIEPEFEGKSEKEARGIAVDMAVEMAAKDYEVFQPSIQPVAVEETIAIKYPALKRIIVGKLDVRTEAAIHDLKSGKRAFGQSDADTEPGITTYGMLRKSETGEAPASYYIDNVVATGKSVCRTNAYRTSRTDAELDRHLSRFAAWARVIDAGNFAPCNPKDWKCSQAYCGYWQSICPYAANR